MTNLNTKELARRVGTAMEREDWATVLSAVSPEVIAHVPAVGDLTGIDALAMFLAETAAKTEDGERFQLLDTLIGDDHVALYLRITAQRAGRTPLDNLTVHLARLDGPLIAEIWFHNFDGQAVAAFWE